MAQEVAYRHSEKHPELLKFNEIAFLFFHDLLNNLKVEEQMLFPSIKKLCKWINYKESSTYTIFDLIGDTVTLLQKEQVAADKDLRSLRILTANYKLTEDADN